ncbi:hypothetical protein scyTo_0022422 [Scyliorhinus torazame]|uniref:DUF5604 domain-containing protein n=1 Tax=Scyliorhinus torazame TaxID=75743 RepID=A0A401Q689_SCYTO|nr:hypothetical protein [Scyliorhinus torazame]
MASTDTMEMAVEDLGISMEEIRQWIDKELEKVDFLKQRKAALLELECWVERKEAEVAHVDGLFEDASRSVDVCESMVKDLYSDLGLQYDEEGMTGKDGAKVSEVIEILDDDEDDDVMAVEPVETAPVANTTSTASTVTALSKITREPSLVSAFLQAPLVKHKLSEGCHAARSEGDTRALNYYNNHLSISPSPVPPSRSPLLSNGLRVK